MLSKLKYAGIQTSHLLTIYKLFIRSVTEYCSPVFHTSLTQQQVKKIELIQSTSLKIRLGSEFYDYKSALTKTSLCSLYDRRCERMKSFALKSAKDKFNKTMFPLNINYKNKDHFRVNFARTSKYMHSTIPQCQRYLNSYAKDNPDAFD